MSGGAIAFMSISWVAVLSLTVWAFARLLGAKRKPSAGEEAP